MFGFGEKKERMTTKQLGTAFSGYVLTKNFDKEEKFIYEQYRQDYFPQVSEKDFLREWALFDAWMLMNTFSDYFRDNPLGSDAYQYFISSLKEVLVQEGLVASMAEADVLFALRHKTYEEEMQANREPNYVYWVSKKFCGFLGDDKDPQAIMMHSATFPRILRFNAQALTGVMEKCELVAEL